MNFEEKKERAIAIMESKKMWSSNYAPPLLRLAWRMGVRIPPLPFAPFWQVALLMGTSNVGLHMERYRDASNRCHCQKLLF